MYARKGANLRWRSSLPCDFPESELLTLPNWLADVGYDIHAQSRVGRNLPVIVSWRSAWHGPRWIELEPPGPSRPLRRRGPGPIHLQDLCAARSRASLRLQRPLE